ncbi:DUF6090 family protein [Ichthyenterobacterium sp. W332]|uniref:DUF6090 family protein n=1 Tax=Microcosmobacter mediterraneus TaxID=3075607 RepID=A0ABU2YJ34_9FLAO|nr:DUF6090 family protein [Ichthyenterobacterium sp. W332]MDT0558187.1 DUF6090 family protein [Ichthyenterobacterium sp. W332]
MIKIFRKIRYNLMETGKTGKYFKYAIGEIILVMIGILLALQVNNWNNNRIDAKREANYIKNIERDLNNQLKAIQTQIDFEAEVADNCKLALKSYNDTNALKIDSTFAVALGSISTRRTFLNPNPAYIELISSGNIELLKNETFKDKLINYYEELERIEKVIDGNNSLYTDQEFIPTALKFGVMDASEDWKNIFRSYRRQYSSPNPLTKENMKRLLGISARVLQNEENELLFINHLASREGYAMVHILLLTEFKIQTQKLLEAIKDY